LTIGALTRFLPAMSMGKRPELSGAQKRRGACLNRQEITSLDLEETARCARFLFVLGVV